MADETRAHSLDAPHGWLGDLVAYRPLRLVSCCGSTQLCRAVEVESGQEVLIKVLDGTLAEDEDSQELFFAESSVMAELSHPNLLEVRDLKRCDGRVVIVTEWVEGERLDAVVQSGRMPLIKVLRVGMQLSRLLSYLHERNLFRCDLSLANILLRADGTLKVMHVGRSVHGAALRSDRLEIGPYISPEEALGLAPTPASALFQLGVALYLMLTGELPWAEARTLNNLDQVLPSLGERQRNLPPLMVRLVDRLLSFDPSLRPQRAMEVLKTLQELASQVGPTPRDSGSWRLVVPRPR